MGTELYIFISSKLQELAQERQLVQDLIPTLNNEFITLRAWGFEKSAPASTRSIREVYLEALKQSVLYLGLFWNEYGEWTIDEFDHATTWAIDRHIYVKNVNADQRDPRLQTFLQKQSDVVSGITPKWFTSLDNLREQVAKSIRVWLQDRLVRRPGDSRATLAEFSDDLPELPSRLVGRDNILIAVTAQLAEGQRVLLQGFGGMGKSALAATLAANWIEADRGNVLWLLAGSEDAVSQLEALASAFDSQQTIANAPANDKPRIMRKILSENAVSLIVLDDVWDGPALVQVLKAVPRKLPVLVTARQRYALDNIIEVGRLDATDALQALAYYAGQDFNDDDDAREICRQVGDHALALEIAGKTLKVDRIPPAELLHRIATAPHEMIMPEDFAEEGRSSITELLMASLFTLDEGVREVFLAFGALFAPTATPDLIAHYMGRDQTSIEAALALLQRRGLADRTRVSDHGAATYRVHDLAFSYARTIVERQSPDHQRAAIAACRAYAREHEEDLIALEAAFNNILGAASAARQIADHRSLVDIMRTLAGPFLSSHGHTLTMLELLDAAIDATDNLEADQDRNRYYLVGKRGNTHYDRGDFVSAQHCYQTALDLARRLGEEASEVRLLCMVGKVLSDQNDSAAEALFEQAYQLAKSLQDGFLIGYALEHQGYYAQSQEDYEAARHYFTEEAALAERIDDPETTFFALLNLGSVEHKLDRFAEALAHHNQALAIAHELQNDIWKAHALQSIGEDHHQLEDSTIAQQCLNEAFSLFQARGLSMKATEVEAYAKAAGYTIQLPHV